MKSSRRQLAIHNVPTCLCWVQQIPEESWFGIFTNLIFLHIILVHAPTRKLATYPNTTWLELVLNIIAWRVVQYWHETVVKVENYKGGVSLGFLVQLGHRFVQQVVVEDYEVVKGSITTLERGWSSGLRKATKGL